MKLQRIYILAAILLSFAGLAQKESTLNPGPNPMCSRGYIDIKKPANMGGKVIWSFSGAHVSRPSLSLVVGSFVMTAGKPEKVRATEERVDFSTGQSYINTRYETKSRAGDPVILPGIRLQSDPNKVLQVAIMGMSFDKGFAHFPMPMVQWYCRI